MTFSPGRPKKYDFNSRDEEQLLLFIKDYQSNINPDPLIKYKTIWEYTNSLFQNNLFPFETSYDFWKRKGRLGRTLVDFVNETEQKKIFISKSEKIDLIDIKDLVEKYGGKNKELLWKNLEPYDKHISNFVKKINNIQDENTMLKKTIHNNEETIKNLKESNDKLQKLVYSLFIYSNKDNHLVNLINTGQSNSKIINLALEKTFEDPIAFFKELTCKFNLEIAKEPKIEQSKIVPIFKNTHVDNDDPEYDL